MKKVITYGTYDLLHQGHINLLRRAKELGDYLIVGVTSDSYDKGRGKLNVCNSLIERIEAVKATGYADEIIVEEYEGQKIDDIIKYGVDIFAIGSDWRGKFDYLKDYCEVVYLERTRGISSTLLRNPHIIKLGIIGCGRIANRFVLESKYVSGVDVSGVYNPHISSATAFAEKNELSFSTDNLDEFLERIDAVYIASPNFLHAKQSILCMRHGKHVLCEKPLASNAAEVREMIAASRKYGVALMEAMKPTMTPNFLAVKENLHRIGVVRRYFSCYCQYSSRYDKFKEGIVLNAFNPELSNGAIMDIGVYTIYPMVVLFGRPKRIDASGIVLSSGADGQGAVNFLYEGMNATVLYSKIANSSLPTEIQGEDGNIVLDRVNIIGKVTFSPRGTAASGKGSGSEPQDISALTDKDEYYYEVKAFIDLIEAGKLESGINSHEHSLITLEIIDEIRRQLGVVYPADKR